MDSLEETVIAPACTPVSPAAAVPVIASQPVEEPVAAVNNTEKKEVDAVDEAPKVEKKQLEASKSISEKQKLLASVLIGKSAAPVKVAEKATAEPVSDAAAETSSPVTPESESSKQEPTTIETIAKAPEVASPAAPVIAAPAISRKRTLMRQPPAATTNVTVKESSPLASTASTCENNEATSSEESEAEESDAPSRKIIYQGWLLKFTPKIAKKFLKSEPTRHNNVLAVLKKSTGILDKPKGLRATNFKPVGILERVYWRKRYFTIYDSGHMEYSKHPDLRHIKRRFHITEYGPMTQLSEEEYKVMVAVNGKTSTKASDIYKLEGVDLKATNMWLKSCGNTQPSALFSPQSIASWFSKFFISKQASPAGIEGSQEAADESELSIWMKHFNQFSAPSGYCKAHLTPSLDIVQPVNPVNNVRNTKNRARKAQKKVASSNSIFMEEAPSVSVDVTLSSSSSSSGESDVETGTKESDSE